MTFNDSTEAFENAPTYEEKANTAPIRVRETKTNEILDTMYWPGSAEKATPVIDWILLNDETARYHDGLDEHIAFDTYGGLGNPGTVGIPPGSWILRRHSDGSFLFTGPIHFHLSYTYL